MVELICSCGCGLTLTMKQSQYDYKKKLGQQNFYRQECFRATARKKYSPWRKCKSENI